MSTLFLAWYHSVEVLRYCGLFTTHRECVIIGTSDTAIDWLLDWLSLEHDGITPRFLQQPFLSYSPLYLLQWWHFSFRHHRNCSSFLAYSWSLTAWALKISPSSIDLSVRQYSLALLLTVSTTFRFALAIHWDAKWFIIPQAKYLLPNAGQFCLLIRYFPLQYLDLFVFYDAHHAQDFHFHACHAPTFHVFWHCLSHLSSTFSHLLLWNPLPCLIWFLNEFTFSPLPRFYFILSIIQVLHRHQLRHHCRLRHRSLWRSSQSCFSWILQIIWSLTSESVRSPKWQVIPKSFKSVINFSSDLPGFWKRENNLYLSTVLFFFGLQCLSNASITCFKFNSCIGTLNVIILISSLTPD